MRPDAGADNHFEGRGESVPFAPHHGSIVAAGMGRYRAAVRMTARDRRHISHYDICELKMPFTAQAPENVNLSLLQLCLNSA